MRDRIFDVRPDGSLYLGAREIMPPGLVAMDWAPHPHPHPDPEPEPEPDLGPSSPDCDLWVGDGGDPGEYDTIQEAVNDAHPGARIGVAGTVVGQPALFEERVRFMDAPENLTLLAWPPRSVTTRGFDTDGCGPGLTLDGFGVENEADKHAIFIGSEAVSLRNLHIHDVDFGIWCDHRSRPRDGMIKDCLIERCGMGAVINGNGWFVTNTEIRHLINRGHDTDYARAFGDDIAFIGNYFHGTNLADIGNSHTDGLQVFMRDAKTRGLTHFRFEGNIVAGFNEGLMFESGAVIGGISSGNIQGNILCGDFLDGPGGGWAANLKGGIRDLSFTENFFINLKHHGIGLRYGTQAQVAHNIFYNGATNYWADDDSMILEGSGHNVMNSLGWRGLPHPTDRVIPDMKVEFKPPASIPFSVEDCVEVTGLE